MATVLRPAVAAACALLLAVAAASLPVEAAAPRAAPAAKAASKGPPPIQFQSPEAIARWINAYRQRPEPQRLPEAVKAMVQFGIFKDNESSGMHLGFMGGVIGANPGIAEDLIARMFPMPPEDHIAVIKAIAYSGLPDWKQLLSRFAERMPARASVVDRYLTNKLPALADLALDSGPAPLDVLWGRYFATGSYEPIVRIVSVLQWSGDANNVERLTIGSMAKWTLAQNASRDMDLLQMLKASLAHEPRKSAAMLREVIDAAEIGETGKIRKDALTAIETLKVKGPENVRKTAWWGMAGQTALALGCIVAGALGHVEVGIPCVIGGALSGAAIKFATPQQ
jgi:hypothetical protein